MIISTPAARADEEIIVVVSIACKDTSCNISDAILENEEVFKYRDSLSIEGDNVEIKYFNILKRDEEDIMGQLEADLAKFSQYYYKQLPEKPRRQQWLRAKSCQ